MTRARYPDREGRARNGDVELHYEVYGEGEPTVFLLPAWQVGHSRAWKAQVPFLSRHYRVLTYDARGSGKSDRPSGPERYSYEHLVADAWAVMDAARTERAVVMGCSMGGHLAALMAAERPERIAGAVLIAPSSPFGPSHAYRNVDFEERLDAYDGWHRYNTNYVREDFRGFAKWFDGNCVNVPHSTKQVEDMVGWTLETTPETIIDTMRAPDTGAGDEETFRHIRCPVLFLHGDNDVILPVARTRYLAALCNGQVRILPGSGHVPHARIPAKVNLILKDFVDEIAESDRAARGEAAPPQGGGKLVELAGSGHMPEGRVPAKVNLLIMDFIDGLSGASATPQHAKPVHRSAKRALYLSSPIGLGHGRRDLAIARELRRHHPGLEVDWLAQHPVTALLKAEGERIHPASHLLANESAHIEAEADGHDLHVFEAFRRMDEILIANFMLFQEIVQDEDYDLILADEAWDVDYFWHEHPELKRAPLAWFTDFVGFLPMPEKGERDAFLTADYNAEMIEHVEGHPGLRDLAIFVGNPEDCVDTSMGPDLPGIRAWTEKHFRFSGYITGFDPADFGPKNELRAALGYRPDERVCIVTVGGSGVGRPLLRRILAAYPLVKRRIPDLRMIAVAGPRIDPASLGAPTGVEVRPFVPDLPRHLAAADLAIVQGGLTTCMELTASGTPFIYVPIRNHFEQNFHVRHRLERYNAGRRLSFEQTDPDSLAAAMIELLAAKAAFRPVETDGAARAAAMIAGLLSG